jgi:hypothetical protein
VIDVGGDCPLDEIAGNVVLGLIPHDVGNASIVPESSVPLALVLVVLNRLVFVNHLLQ